MRQRLRQARADVSTMRRIFPEAERLARAAGRSEPGVDDLVLAGLDLPDGIARRALAACGVTPRDLRAATAEVRATDRAAAGSGTDEAAAPADRPSRGVYRSEPSMQMTFHRAVGIANAERSHLRSRDLLLAALEAPDGVVSTALDHLGVDPDALRDAVLRDGRPADDADDV